MTELELNGLAADNLLAFLALLGLLRALENGQPDWRPRVLWSGPPWRARLYVDAEVAARQVAETADASVSKLGEAHAFNGRKNIDFTGEEFRALAAAAARAASPDDRRRADLLAALASDGSVRAKDGRVESTALCAIHGQGRQNFLERLEALGRTKPERNGGGIKVAEALFEPWRYEDVGGTFRWDPGEDRRYALGFADPSGQKIRTVAGANRLAAIGFPVLACTPAAGGLKTTAVRRSRRGAAISWPLWFHPIGLAAVRVLLAHPELVAEIPEPARLMPYGVVEVMRARRIQTGKYVSFEPARALWGMASLVPIRG